MLDSRAADKDPFLTMKGNVKEGSVNLALSQLCASCEGESLIIL